MAVLLALLIVAAPHTDARPRPTPAPNPHAAARARAMSAMQRAQARLAITAPAPSSDSRYRVDAALAVPDGAKARALGDGAAACGTVGMPVCPRQGRPIVTLATD